MISPASAAAETVSSCLLCQSTSFVPVAHRDRHGQPLTTVLCEGCGFVFTHPRPTRAEVDHFYRADYRREYKQSFTPRPKHVYRAGRVALERLDYLLPLLKDGDHVLDVGAGGGELLFILRELGHRVQGIEPNLGYGGAARDFLGLPVQVAGYHEAQVEPGSQHVITSFHVVEHLLDPVDALSVFAGWLHEDGLLLIEVPHVLSNCQWPQSRYHRGHLQHFSAATLALAGRLAGLHAVDSFTSADGGNLMVIFRRADSTPAAPAVLPGHAARVLRHLRGHTARRHALSLSPWLRPLRRLRDRVAEGLQLAREKEPRALLHQCAAQARRLQARTGQPASPAKPLPLLHGAPCQM